MKKLNILIAGATGYVGKKLLDAIYHQSFDIRIITRSKNNIEQTKGIKNFQIDLALPDGLDEAMEKVDIAFYLVHSLNEKNFTKIEERCASNFAHAAKKANVKRIIYLSGLFDDQSPLSPHLQSRKKVGEILKTFGGQTVEFRASAIFGAGSQSYELISNLVERLPIMVTPKWVYKKTQPISVDDVIFYLTQSMNIEQEFPPIIEIGGKDVVSYADMMQEYAKRRGLYRLLIPVPFLSLHFSSLWLYLFTPIQAQVGRKLIESLSCDTFVTDKTTQKLFNHEPMSIVEMIDKSLIDETNNIIGSGKNHEKNFKQAKKIFGLRVGRYIIKRDIIHITAQAEKVFRVICDLGGENGWYYCNWAWRLRAFIDRVFGGPGFSFGKDNSPLKAGKIIDFWQVEKVINNQSLLLKAIMKMPGDAYLEFYLEDLHEKGLNLFQYAIFRPKGLLGGLYWYLLYPIHEFIFIGLLKAIKRKSEQTDA